MTEGEWLAEQSRNQWMAIQLADMGVPRTKAGRRKLRLFACACSRIIWEVLPDDRLRDAVLTAEEFADGAKSKADLQTARANAEPLAKDGDMFGRASMGERVAIDMAIASTDAQAHNAAFVMTACQLPLGGLLQTDVANARLCQLLRDIFGNPFRPVAFDPNWRTATAVGLAQTMYDARHFNAMPILADAIQDAGCEDAAILGHCRDADGVHVRGCWVVDLVLGKA